MSKQKNEQPQAAKDSEQGIHETLGINKNLKLIDEHQSQQDVNDEKKGTAVKEAFSGLQLDKEFRSELRGPHGFDHQKASGWWAPGADRSQQGDINLPYIE
ncbi:8152_t:CDS:2 [Scutellospora calospora]|uniref:8152_t:CDS:1 n=1 Tax=Scutellospora calospora TaxID=85575 RepID=A0ACA9KM92_9GLOM|nr:8152_t:CDS:2 [Scutellospora calospora]